MSKKWVRPVISVIFVGLLALTVRLSGFAQLDEFKIWIAEQGVWGPLIFVAIYALSTVAVMPGSVLTITAGLLFGSVVGVIAALSGATLGAALCFLIARYAARETVMAYLGKNEKFRKLDKLTEQHGAVIVAITRLVPLFPFNLLNYGFGLTGVPFRTYAGWSLLCMLPFTIVYVVGADAFLTVIHEGRIPFGLLLIVLLILSLLTGIVRNLRKRISVEDE